MIGFDDSRAAGAHAEGGGASLTARTGFPREDPGVEIGADHLPGAWRDGTGLSVVRLYRLEERE